MKEEISLLAKVRPESGSSAMNRLRRAGHLPGVVYGSGDPVSVTFDAAAFATLQRHHSSENLMVSLQVEGDKTRQVLIREVQHHPLTGAPLHVDFYELSLTKRVTVAVPVDLQGTPVGVAQGGGVMEHLLREVEIECLPADILEQLEVDVSGLNVGERLTVGDIPLDSSKYGLVTAPDIAIASVAAPRVEAAASTEEAAAEAKPEAAAGAES